VILSSPPAIADASLRHLLDRANAEPDHPPRHEREHREHRERRRDLDRDEAPDGIVDVAQWDRQDDETDAIVAGDDPVADAAAATAGSGSG